ncbi:tRNA_anti-like [Cyclobacterium xiamenense]|uniref:tRNA_anti-like n=1 Tax=Cyclobacterium xiamenense TaxID=1297121 RepID=A0A1H6W1Y4_9BACT|nr:hypothetical protein [Cyclobacterium xiamenense]SEJ10991.1 tRNA_anti-like [Cyclobacterium xiamenense]
MKEFKWLKPLLITLSVALAIGLAVVAYLLNMPHRDVQSTKTDYAISASHLVEEFLANGESAYEKYLDEAGESKVLEVEGEVFEISKDFNEQTVVLLKAKDDDAGVSCTFLPSDKDFEQLLKIGAKVRVKGVIRSGATFDSDLQMFEHVILEKCDLLTNV